eukprot:977326_1
MNNESNQSSPMSNSGARFTPSLAQSTTPSTKPKFAQVFSRISAKVKKSKNKHKNKKNKNKNKSNKANNKKNTHENKSKNKSKNKAPIQKHNVETKETDMECINDAIIETYLNTRGYCIDKKLADTLQGKVYRCKSIINETFYNAESVVIKVTRKDLHLEGMTILDNGKKKAVQENILKERDIIKELTELNSIHNGSIYMTRYINFFENNKYYFLVMEDGGNDLFEYVVKCHNLIRKGKLDRKEWRLMCKKIFKQIIELMDYLHNTHNICHLDISLENMLIKNGTILQNVNTGKISLNRNITVKFCDFGLSEKFKPNSDFKCTKYVGKTRYKSPELWTKKMIFDARSNDVWSLGITLFMMIIGVPPLKYPDMSDENFKLIISGQILELIQSWNRAKYMTPQVLDLLKKMLTKETHRINLYDIKKHSWVKLL